MISIEEVRSKLWLHYNGDNGVGWVTKRLKERGSVTLRRTFTFTQKDMIQSSNPQDDDHYYADDLKFVLGKKHGAYYKIEARILGTKNDVYLSTEMTINDKTFIATRDISIFGRIDKLVSEPIYVGGDKEGAIPLPEFATLLAKFPGTTELRHYAASRISIILKEYMGTMTDAQLSLNKYLSKRPLLRRKEKDRELRPLYEMEVQKYEFIRDRIKEELKNQNSYSEDEWRDLMLDFILLIFPKYVAVLRNVHIKDYYSKSKPTDRYIDIALVDANGNLDIIEIKKPFDDCLVSNTHYRGNHTPKKELSGAIMQAEKYIFHLSKWGMTGELEMTKKQQASLPKGMSIKVTNPKALVILGRCNGLTAEKLFDLELIKRKYANIMDIITYDDLLKRLENIIQKFKKAP